MRKAADPYRFAATRRLAIGAEPVGRRAALDSTCCSTSETSRKRVDHAVRLRRESVRRRSVHSVVRTVLLEYDRSPSAQSSVVRSSTPARRSCCSSCRSCAWWIRCGASRHPRSTSDVTLRGAPRVPLRTAKVPRAAARQRGSPSALTKNLSRPAVAARRRACMEAASVRQQPREGRTRRTAVQTRRSDLVL
jgi:hypothetical protein